LQLAVQLPSTRDDDGAASTCLGGLGVCKRKVVRLVRPSAVPTFLHRMLAVISCLPVTHTHTNPQDLVGGGGVCVGGGERGPLSSDAVNGWPVK